MINDKILFDTGQTDVFIKNGEKLGIDFFKIERVIISHGHYDHIGGLIFLQNVANPEVFIHKKALVERYSGSKFAGVPYDWNKIELKVNFIDSDISTDEVRIITNIKMREDIIDEKFRLSDGRKDFFEDEINIVIENFLFTGCAHRGIENIVEQVIKRYNIEYVVGGFHLVNASSERIRKITELFEEYDLKVIPLHCTGENAIKFMKDRLKDKCIILNSGDEWRR